MGRPALQVIQKQNGLNFQFDPVDIPPGAFLRMENVMVGRESVIESRRGLDRYGAAAAAQIDAILQFEERLLRHTSAGVLQFDSDGAGTWTSYTGTFDNPDANTRMRSVEARGTHYITTDEGVFSQDTLTEDPVRAGLEEFLDVRADRVADGGLGFFVADSQVSYRCIFVRVNENERVLESAPSFIETETNAFEAATYTSSGTTVTVTLNNHGFSNGDTITVRNADDPALDGIYIISNVMTNTFDFTAGAAPSPVSGALEIGYNFSIDLSFPLPDDIVAGDFYEVYRSQLSASAATLPAPEFFKVVRREITAGDITAGSITHNDDVGEAFLGTRLYTNPTLGSIARANHRPPFATDIVAYKGHVIYSNIKREQELELQLIEVAGITDGTDSITIAGETYTFATAEDAGMNEFQRFTANTLAENVRDTAKSLVRVINLASSTLYAFYISSAVDAPGKMLIRRRLISGVQFSATANVAGTGDNFEPVLPTSGTDVSSVEPGGANKVAISKFENPEAVTRVFSEQPVGKGSDEILRILALRDSVIIFQSLGGMFVLTGETDGVTGESFIIKSRDETVKLVGKATAVVLQNSVYLYSDQGFVRANESGAEIVGRKVNNRVKDIVAVTNWEALSHAIAYESEHLYICFGPEVSTDTNAVLAWTYSALNDEWTNGFRKDISAGRVLTTDGRVYMSHGTDDFVLQERKDLTMDDSDYRDEEIAVNVDAVSTSTYRGNAVTQLDITYTYTGAELTFGFEFAQGNEFAQIVEVEELTATTFRVTLEEQLAEVTTGAASVFIPIYIRLRTAPLIGRNASLLKHFIETHFEFEEDRPFDHFVGYRSDLEPTETFNEDPYSTFPTNAGWGVTPWGETPWGDPGDPAANPLIVAVAPNYQRARRLEILYDHNSAHQKVSLLQITSILREISRRSAVRVPRSF